MSKVVLRDYQEEAVKFAIKVPKSLYCMRVGSGKTICAMFSARALMKRKLADKIIIACTATATNVFIEDLQEKAGVKVKLIEDSDEFIDFMTSKSKICLIKHSMFEKIGNDLVYLKKLFQIIKTNKPKITLIIDEAHKLQNTEGVGHEAYERMSFAFDRVLLYTATPYSSCLSQFYGLIHLIYPKLWKNKREFFDNYIDEITIRDPRTGRVARKEKVAYRNLKQFREKILPFTYFYYPPIPLVHTDHTTTLDNYDEYDNLCQGVLTDEDKAKIEGI